MSGAGAADIPPASFCPLTAFAERIHALTGQLAASRAARDIADPQQRLGLERLQQRVVEEETELARLLAAESAAYDRLRRP